MRRKTWQLRGWILLIFIAVVAGIWNLTERDYWPFETLSWWQWWEAVEIFITGIYSGFFYFSESYELERDPGLRKHKRVRKLLGTIALVVSLLLLVMALCVLMPKIATELRFNHIVRAISAVTVGICYLLYDLLVFRYAEQRITRREFGLSALYCEFPLCVALATTCLSVVTRSGEGLDEDPKTIETFLGGAIAFQLLVSTTMFAIIQSPWGDQALLGAGVLTLQRVEELNAPGQTWVQEALGYAPEGNEVIILVHHEPAANARKRVADLDESIRGELNRLIGRTISNDEEVTLLGESN